MDELIGKKFKTRGKRQDIATVVDKHVTINMAGRIVKTVYVTTHDFAGQTVTDYETPQASIIRGLLTAV